MAKRSRWKQGVLRFPCGWGGYREGAGRKPAPGRRNVSHKRKPELKKRCPLHITIRLRDGLPSMRRKAAYRVLREVFAAAKERFGFRLIHYSVMGNHCHLIVEADDRRALTRGMSGLMIRMARRLNRLWSRRGRLFADHFHEHQVHTPREVRAALVYVLNNARRHGYSLHLPIDHFSSGPWFNGWSIDIELVGSVASWQIPVTQARSWLLRTGWLRHSRIRTSEIPADAA